MKPFLKANINQSVATSSYLYTLFEQEQHFLFYLRYTEIGAKTYQQTRLAAQGKIGLSNEELSLRLAKGVVRLPNDPQSSQLSPQISRTGPSLEMNGFIRTHTRVSIDASRTDHITITVGTFSCFPVKPLRNG